MEKQGNFALILIADDVTVATIKRVSIIFEQIRKELALSIIFAAVNQRAFVDAEGSAG